ncbi:MAG: hypothetical protein JXL80_06325, partial [Planctomycetes bacterium]|nr:hypothetical protein [Planctomycetota bacterium]
MTRPWPLWLRNLVVALAHLGLFALSFWGAYCLRLDFKVPPWTLNPTEVAPEFSRYWDSLYQLMPLVLVIKVAVFWYFRLYSSWGRYVGVQDLIETFKASHVSTAIIVIAVLVYSYVLKSHFNNAPPIPGAVFITDWAGTIALVGGVRFAIRIYREGMRPIAAGGLTNVLLVGAGDAGEAVLREMQRLPVERYRVVGFVDDNPGLRGSRIHAVPVLGDTSQIGKICETYDVEELVIALANPTRQLLRRIIEFCKGSKLIF